MASRVVFSQGRWIQVRIPPCHDPAWTASDLWYYAASWASATARGFSETRAEQIAEAVVSKRLYPGCVFYKDLERDIQSLQVGDS